MIPEVWCFLFGMALGIPIGGILLALIEHEAIIHWYNTHQRR